MNFIVTYKDNGLTAALMQNVTPYEGGYFKRLCEFDYLVIKDRPAYIIRKLATSIITTEEIEYLAAEANRFMYMYCCTEIKPKGS